MAKTNYSAGFLRKFVREIAEHAAAEGIGDTFVKICQAFYNCGEQVANNGAKVAAAVAATAPAAAAAGATLMGLPILGPLAISVALFGVTVYMKHAREAKEASERDEAFAQIKEISAAVAAINRRQDQDDAQENLIKLVESKPVWARISGADQPAFARLIHNEIQTEFKELTQALDDLGILGSDTNERVRIIEESINAILQANGAIAAVLNQIAAGVKTANAKIDQVLATLQSQGALLALEDRAPPRPNKYVPRPGPMQALVDALWDNGRASVTGHAVSVGARAAAQGDGGQGKSVLALAYAHDYADRYPGGCYRVIVEKQSLEAALARMTPALPALQQMPQADKARLARAFLSRPPRCLLIIDNVDRLSDWNDEAFKALIPSGACHVIVTSREEHLPGITPVPVGKLEENEARQVLAVFRPSAADPAHAPAVASIIRSVERLAVAVASVGALMAIGEDDDWAAYAKRLEDIPLEQYPEGHAEGHGHTGYSRRVFAALDDLFDRLSAPAQRAIDYAAILPQDLIPAVDHLNPNPPGVTPADWLAMLLAADAEPSKGAQRLDLGMRPTGRPWEPRDFVRKLQSLGLLTPASPERTLWSLHRLHAKRCRERFEMAGNSKVAPLWSAIAACAAARRSVVVGVDEPGKVNSIDNPLVVTDASLRWELAPLAGVAAALAGAGLLKEANAVTGWLSVPLMSLGRFAEARAVLESLLTDREATRAAVGGSDFATLLSNLAMIQQDQGDLPGARASMERAIAIQQKHFPPDHPTFATSYSNLAAIQQDQGDLPGARASMERAIAIQQKHSPPDHPTFATSYNNMACICLAEGDRAAACANFKKALAILLKHFDESHPDVKTVRRSMAAAGCAP